MWFEMRQSMFLRRWNAESKTKTVFFVFQFCFSKKSETKTKQKQKQNQNQKQFHCYDVMHDEYSRQHRQSVQSLFKFRASRVFIIVCGCINRKWMFIGFFQKNTDTQTLQNTEFLTFRGFHVSWIWLSTRILHSFSVVTWIFSMQQWLNIGRIQTACNCNSWWCGSIIF